MQENTPRFPVEQYWVKQSPTAPDTFFILNKGTSRWLILNAWLLYALILCDGDRTPCEVKKELTRKYMLDHETADKLVTTALEQAEKLELFHSHPHVTQTDIELPPLHLESLYVEITSSCNLRCKHCYHGEEEFTDEHLSLEALNRLVKEAQELGAKSFAISGGEPLLHEDLFELIEALVRGEFHVTLITNGTLIDREKAEKIAAAYPGIKVQLSIEGGSAEVNDLIRGEGSFKEAMKGLDELREAGFSNVDFSFTANRLNLNDVANIVKLGENKGVKKVRMSWLTMMGTAETNEDQLALTPDQWYQLDETLYKASEKHSGKLEVGGCMLKTLTISSAPRMDSLCPLGTGLYVTPNGDVFPCQLFHDPRFRVGNIHTEPLEEILHSDALRSLRETCADRINHLEECGLCQWKCFCMGGCIARAFLQNGDVHTPADCEVKMRCYEQLALNELEKAASS